MFKWIRQRLGLDDDRNKAELHYEWLVERINAQASQLQLHNRALGRIIAKVDPTFNLDYNDPRVRAESDRIGAEVMRRLLSEHNQSNPTSRPITP